MIPITDKHYELLEQWYKYAKDNEHKYVASFVKETSLITFSNYPKAKVTAKNWHYCSIVLDVAEDDMNKAMPIIEITIGLEAANMFKNFVEKEYKKKD